MRTRSNQWQRIGIILSVIWFIGFLLIDQNGVRQVWFSYDDDMDLCATKLHEMQKNKGLQIGLMKEYRKCKDDTFRLYRNAIGRILLTDGAGLIVGWTIAWWGFVSLRWIKRGFAQSAEQ